MIDNITILQDSDCDGLCSAMLFYSFLIKYNYPKSKITTLFHTGKTHGVTFEIYNQIKNNSLVVVNDAHCDDKWGELLVKEKNCKVIDLNHHDVELQKYSLSINNQQSPLIRNKALSGTGIVFQFIRYYCQKQKDNWYKSLLDIVMFGNISDVMSMKCYPYENRAFNVYGIKKINNPFLKYLIQEQCGDDWCLNDLVWSVSPLVNNLCRTNNQELKERLFNCFVGNDLDYEECLKQLRSSKRKNDELVKQSVDSVEILYHKDIIIAQYEKTGATGLIAQKMLSKYKVPIFLGELNKETNMFSGSFRTNIDFKEKMLDSGYFIHMNGHKLVGGFEFNYDDFDNIKKYVEKLDLDIETEEQVCASYDVKNIPSYLFNMFEQDKNLWITDVPYPQFHIKNIQLNTSNIQYLNKYKTTLKFTIGDVSFIKTFCSKMWRQENQLDAPNTILNIEVIGKLKLDKYNNKTVEIDKIEIKPFEFEN